MQKKQETIAKINKAKSWFFERINKIDKPVDRLIKNKGRKIKSIKLEMKMERSQQTTQKYKGSLRDYYQQLYANKMDNVEEMDRFLEKYNFPKLDQEEIENLNRPITSMEIETVVRNLPAKQKPRTRRLHS